MSARLSLLLTCVTTFGCVAQDYDQFVATERAELVRQLDSLDRRDAAERLGRMGSLAAPAVPQLIELLREDADGRYSYVGALGKIRDVRAVQPIANILAEERHGNRSALHHWCVALGKFDSPEIVQPLLDILRRGESDEVEMAAFMGVANFVSNHPDALSGILRDESVWDVFTLHMAFFWFVRSAQVHREHIRNQVPPLLDSDAPFTRAGALRLIALFPDLVRQEEITAQILALMSDSDIRVQHEAAKVAVLLGSGAAIEPLLAFLNSDDSELRVRAAQSLGVVGQGSPAVVDQLRPLLQHSDEQLRGAAARALGDLVASVAADDLLALITSGTWDDKSNAAYALGRINEPRSLDTLIHLLISPTPLYEAFRALLNFDNQRARDALAQLDLAERPDEYLQRAVYFGRVDGIDEFTVISGLIDPESEPAELTYWAMGSLGRSGDAGWPTIRTLTEAKNEDLAVAATSMLIRHGDDSELERLVRFGRTATFDKVVNIVDVLSENGRPAHVPALIELLERPGGWDDRRHLPEKIADTLHEITGENFGEVAAAWKLWWDTNSDELD